MGDKGAYIYGDGMPLTFMSGELKLEGVLHLPERGSAALPAVVLCHPHPLYGGNMDNNVVLAVSGALYENGIAALRFNFRGVGASKGVFAGGEGEKDDALAALAALAERPEIDGARLGIMGYSFGGMVALDAGSKSEAVRAIGAVSPVLLPGILQGASKPVFLISGSADHVVAPADLYREAAGTLLPATVEVVQGVDHFWWGCEREMARKVAAFFRKALNQAEEEK